jgi:hypothetical protein
VRRLESQICIRDRTIDDIKREVKQIETSANEFKPSQNSDQLLQSVIFGTAVSLARASFIHTCLHLSDDGIIRAAERISIKNSHSNVDDCFRTFILTESSCAVMN